jgi:serpin B
MNCSRFVFVLVFCAVTSAWSVETETTAINGDAKAVAEGNNQFATDLYAHLRSEKPTNLFFSPYSISMALAMTEAGARGQTEKEMAEVLHLSLAQDKIHPAFSQLRQALVSKDKTPDFQLRVANRLWGQQGFHFLPTFLQVTKKDYGAELGLVDFQRQPEQARKAINSWIEDQTQNKIKDLLGPGVLNSSTRLVLTNAIYFKAKWLHEFYEVATVDAPFHVSATKQESVKMMRQSERFSYGESDGVQIVELPYDGGNVGMLILLPKRIDGLAALEKRLTNEKVKKWSANLKPRLVELSLPRFKMTAELSLGDVLASMGMKQAFSDRADFSGMSTQEPLLISAVIHKAFVDVNEIGTEAAAATAVAATLDEAPEESVLFRADHPFVFLLQDRETGSILFMGRLANPKE